MYLAIVQVYYICSEKLLRTNLSSFLLINSRIRKVERVPTIKRNFLLSSAIAIISFVIVSSSVAYFLTH